MTEILGLPSALASLDRCAVIGVVNVTPDSFSDGGLWLEPEAAVAHGLALLEQGADLLDVGGESTRPGAARVPVEEELRRVLPVVSELTQAGAMVSIDTTRAAVADAALGLGAVLVNDVSGGLADPAMADLLAEAGVPFVAMHWRGESARMEELAVYGDVVADVTAELSARLDALVRRGVDIRQIVLDPGFGFAKRPQHSWRLFACLDRLLAIGRPLLVGTSRKRFLAGAVHQVAHSRISGSERISRMHRGGNAFAVPNDARDRDAVPNDARDRDAATAATTALAAAAGVWGVRVHDVPASADAVRVVAAVQAARAGAASVGST